MPGTLARTFLTFALGALCLLSPRSAAAQKQRTLTPDFRLFSKLHSEFLPKDRNVIVWLPPGYDKETERRYPVLYMHDGGAVFVTWRIDEIAKPLIASGEIEPLIIVMVYNGGTQEDRTDEYTPTWSPDYRGGGKADAYGRMLVEELKPLVDSEFRTLKDAQNTGLGGVSLGGLLTMYLGLKYPDVFGKLAVMSPSVWWDRGMILGKVKELKQKPASRVWLDIGTGEGQGYVDATKLLRDALLKKGWTKDSDLSYVEAKGGTHDEESFMKRAAPMLKFLFGRR